MVDHDIDSAAGGVTDEPSGTGRYMYAVCRGLDAHALDGVEGLGGAPLATVQHDELTAVVSTVLLSEFGEQPLRRHLEDLAWLEPVVSKHDEVVRAISVSAPTAPLRLATICFDDDAVRARLREWYVPLMHALDRVDGRAEWSVKVVISPRSEGSAAPDEPVLSGADYLRRKKAAAQGRLVTESAAQALARSIHEDLSGRAVASRELPAQDARLSGRPGTMVLNAAYLVPDEAAEPFAARIAELAAGNPELLIDGRGPWPPYSFAMLEQR